MPALNMLRRGEYTRLMLWHRLAFISVYDACAKQLLLMSEAGAENLPGAIAPNVRQASIDDTIIAGNHLADEDVSIHVALD